MYRSNSLLSHWGSLNSFAVWNGGLCLLSEARKRKAPLESLLFGLAAFFAVYYAVLIVVWLCSPEEHKSKQSEGERNVWDGNFSAGREATLGVPWTCLTPGLDFSSDTRTKRWVGWGGIFQRPDLYTTRASHSLLYFLDLVCSSLW